MTDQEKKLVFLEAYTSVLAAVIKNPDEVGKLISISGIPWWLWLSMIGGGLALGTAPFFYLLGRERTLK